MRDEGLTPRPLLSFDLLRIKKERELKKIEGEYVER